MVTHLASRASGSTTSHEAARLTWFCLFAAARTAAPGAIDCGPLDCSASALSA